MTRETQAVVVGADACGLGLVRSLGKNGVSVAIVDSDARRPGMHSRYARHFVSRSMSGPDLVHSLLSLGNEISCRPVLFLTSDAQVETVSMYRKRLEPTFRIALPDHRRVRGLLHKASFQKLAESLGFPVPTAVTVRSNTDIGKLAQLRYPAVVKPGRKEGLRGAAPLRAERVSGPDEAAAVCRAALADMPDLIVQEWIEGEDSDIYFCLQYRAQDGATLRSFTGRKIRSWPPQTGSTASCKPAPEVRETLEPLTTAFFDQVQFIGMCSMEFKQDRRSGAFLMIEPTVGRADWQEEVATLNGVNIPLAAFHDQVGQPPRPCEPVGAPVIWRDPACYWRSVVATRSFAERTPRGTSVTSSCWRTDDPMPLPFFWIEWLRKGWRPSRWLREVLR